MATVGQVLATPETGWKRYEDTDRRITYTGSWSTSTSVSGDSSGNEHYSYNDSNPYYTFKFYGTKFRLISVRNTDLCSNVQVTIDGNITETYSSYFTSLQRCVLVYERNNLSLGVHTVVVIKNTNTSVDAIDLDCIDIDDTGDLLGTGIALTAPESGWRRYDDTDSRINYDSPFYIYSNGSNNASYYGNSCHVLVNNNLAKIKFKFYGAKLRLISSIYPSASNSINISIDGVNYNYSQYSSTSMGLCIMFEKLDLPIGKHTVIINNNLNTNQMALDAIDIDDTGYLLHTTLNQVSDFSQVQSIGDCVPYHYKSATSGVIGTFSKALAADNEIPAASSATPDGLFYWVYVGKDHKGRKKFIADRNLQHSISWDTLNGAGIVNGKPMGPYFKEYDGKKAIYMNGTDEVLKKVNPSIPDLSAFTIEVLWDINSVANASAHYPSAFSFTSETGATNNRINLYIDPQTGGSGTELGWNDGTSSDLRKTAAVPSGLNHFALTYDGATLSEYRNGVLYNSASVLNKIIKLSANTLLLGKGIGYPGGVVTSAYINGILYYFRVWNKALTLDQINTNKYKCKLNDNSIVYSLNENDYDIATLQSKFPTMVGIDSSNIVIADKNKILRLPTGGVSSTDIDNEWDNIIINSTLNNKITANDNNVWHHSLTLINVRSTTATTPTAGNTNRTYRVDSWGYGTSDLANANLGFRPVLLMEMTDKFLIKKDSNYYSIDPKYYDEVNHVFTPLSLSGGSEPNKSDIEIFGFDSLNLLISSVTKGSDTIKPIDKFANCEIKYYTMS